MNNSINAIPQTMKEALLKAGIPLEQAARMTFGELAALPGIAAKTLAVYAELSGRSKEWQTDPANKDGYLVIQVEDGKKVKVPYRLISHYRRLKETLDYFKIDPDYTIGGFSSRHWDRYRRLNEQISDEEIARFIYEQNYAIKPKTEEEEEEAEEEEAEKEMEEEEGGENGEGTPLSLHRKHQKRGFYRNTLDGMRRQFMQELTETYDLTNAPINDRSNAEHLAVLMARRALLDRKLMEIVRGSSSDEDDIDQLLQSISSERFRLLEKAIADLGKQISAREKDLQIGPRERAAALGAVQASDVIQELIEATFELRRRLVVHVQADGILLGIILWHFPEHTPVCAKCGSNHFVVTSPRGTQVDVPFVTEEAEELYVRAADFIPPDAPKMAIFNPVERKPRSQPRRRRRQEPRKELDFDL